MTLLLPWRSDSVRRPGGLGRLNRRVWCKCAALSGCASSCAVCPNGGPLSCLAFSADASAPPHPESGFSLVERCGSFEGHAAILLSNPLGEVEHDLWAASGA